MFGGNLCTGGVLCTRCVLVKFRHTRDHDTGFGWNYAVSTWCMLRIISILSYLLAPLAVVALFLSWCYFRSRVKCGRADLRIFLDLKMTKP